MTIIIRITAVLGAIWSAILFGLLATLGTLLSFIDMSGQHDTQQFVSVICLLEVGLLFALWHAGKLRFLAAPGILLWFVVTGAYINHSLELAQWLDLLWRMMGFFLPVTLTMLFVTLHGVVTWVKARRACSQEAGAMPQAL